MASATYANDQVPTGAKPNAEHRSKHRHGHEHQAARHGNPHGHGGEAHAKGHEKGHEEGHEEIDTENLFGVTQGSDLGKRGEIAAQSEGMGGFGLGDGRYAAWSNVYQLKYSVTDDFRIAPYLATTFNGISGSSSLQDVNALNFQGGGIEFRYRFLNRESAPFGFTVVLDPHANRVDAFDGTKVSQSGVAILALADRELIKDRLFVAFNAFYEPEWTRDSTGMSLDESLLGFSTALTAQLAAHLFVGAEARYLRRYDGVALDSFREDAWYVGPTLAANLCKDLTMTLAWNIKVANPTVADPAFGTSHFANNQVLARFNYIFPEAR
jgi:hypothetical protein